ncbi:MAG: hypothetical protein U0360_05795 [Dehalococcoidia bacterium]
MSTSRSGWESGVPRERAASTCSYRMRFVRGVLVDEGEAVGRLGDEVAYVELAERTQRRERA